MTSPTKIVYEHLKDYPTSTEGYKDIKAPAVVAAVYGEHMSTPREKPVAGAGRESTRTDGRAGPAAAP